jgi:hypothetical protein
MKHRKRRRKIKGKRIGMKKSISRIKKNRGKLNEERNRKGNKGR